MQLCETRKGRATRMRAHLGKLHEEDPDLRAVVVEHKGHQREVVGLPCSSPRRVAPIRAESHADGCLVLPISLILPDVQRFG